MDDTHLDNISLLKHFCSKATILTPTEKLTAIVLLSHRNSFSMMCCPGLTLLASETKFSRYTIQRTLKSLIDKKEIVRLKKISGKKYLKSQYYFLHDIEKAKAIYDDEDSVFNNHHEGEVDNFEFCLAKGWF